MPAAPLLFAYGTLGPADPETAAERGWVADAVRGWLYDLGDYPGLVGAGEEDAPWVEGHVRPVTTDELEGPLDSYEGVGEGLFRRITATARAGRAVWLYEYARPVPQYARGPLTRWDGPRLG